jgi:pyrimidine deaminase RibD-like protein
MERENFYIRILHDVGYDKFKFDNYNFFNAWMKLCSELLAEMQSLQATLRGLGDERGAEALSPIPDREDNKFMRIAIEQAKMSKPEDDRPHPKVGVVVIKNKAILEVAHRGELAKGDHAEYTLLERKLGKMDLTGTTLYTTLEPCTVRGHEKTPCADRIIQRRIGRVVIGMLDPNPTIQGKGVYKLEEEGVRVQLAELLTNEIKELNKDFIAAQKRNSSNENLSHQEGGS